ncbi:MAG TPA: GNAT family N-acetyltransferase [Acidisoma sp.]|jgi:RimJ/RimL family protein N-acetyltransferase|nr:GNAT family N-acetyltransferase [Acidisoma sp.]
MTEPLSALSAQTTERLFLRPLVHADAHAFRAMTDDPAITDCVHFLDSPFTLENAERLILGAGDGRDCFWGVWLRDRPDLLGTVGTHLRDEAEIEIGYWFAPAAQGLGLASEAGAAILTMLRATYPERRIFAECRPENARSWRLLERLGFRSLRTPGARPGRARLTLQRTAAPGQH